MKHVALVSFVLLFAWACRRADLVPPRDLTATARGATQVLVEWSDVATGGSGFEVERRDPGASYLCVGTCDADATEHLDTGLEPGTTYRYRARSVEGLGYSDYSAEVSVTTGAAGLPQAPTQRVIIEEVTGTWCGFCPDGAYRMELISDAHPGLVVCAAFHGGDDLEIPDLDAFTTPLGGVPYYPCGAVGRLDNAGVVFGDRGNWGALAQTFLAQEPTACLRIESAVAGSAVVVTVLYSLLDVPDDPVRVSVYLTEDGVTGYPQANYYNTEAGSAFYAQGNPIEDYVHNHVVRMFLSSPAGDDLEPATPEPGEVYTVTYESTIDPDWDAASVHVVALLHRDGGTALDRPVLNVQVTALGDLGEWD